MKKIIVEDGVYDIKTKKPIRKLELWEEEKGNTICRRLYIEGDTGRRNRYVDRHNIEDESYRFNTYLDMEIERFISPTIKHIENFTYQKT